MQCVRTDLILHVSVTKNTCTGINIH